MSAVITPEAIAAIVAAEVAKALATQDAPAKKAPAKKAPAKKATPVVAPSPWRPSEDRVIKPGTDYNHRPKSATSDATYHANTLAEALAAVKAAYAAGIVYCHRVK